MWLSRIQTSNNKTLFSPTKNYLNSCGPYQTLTTLWFAKNSMNQVPSITMLTSDLNPSLIYVAQGSLTTKVVTPTSKPARRLLHGRTTLRRMAIGWNIHRQMSQYSILARTLPFNSGLSTAFEKRLPIHTWKKFGICAIVPN